MNTTMALTFAVAFGSVLSCGGSNNKALDCSTIDIQSGMYALSSGSTADAGLGVLVSDYSLVFSDDKKTVTEKYTQNGKHYEVAYSVTNCFQE